MMLRAPRRPFLPLALLASMLVTAACREAAEGPTPEDHHARNLLLITIDTLRADHLSAAGHPDRLTPHLDALSRRGVLAPAVVTPANTTLPAHASLFTSLPPEGHGGFGNGLAIRPDLDTLARACRETGMATAAMVSSWVVGPGWNLEQGFDEYIPLYKCERQETRPLSGSRTPPLRAADTTRAARRWLAGHRERPFMLWLHYMDPHQAYDPPPPYGLSDTPPGSADRPHHPDEFLALFLEQRQLPPSVARTVRQEYAGEVAYTDRCIGELLGTLARLDLARDTLVVVTADHGEALGEKHGYFGHTLSLAEMVNRVPLIVTGPNVRRGLLLRPATLLDAAPTILALLGLEAPGEFRGRDLSPLISGKTTSAAPGGPLPEPLLFTRGEDGRRAWLVDGLKATFDPEGNITSLHDLAGDPREVQDLLAEAPELAGELHRRYIVPHTELAELAADLAGAGDRRQLDDETARRLRDLGYVDR